MRPALEHLARNPDLRLARVEARIFAAPGGIQRAAASYRGVRPMIRRVPVTGPFPDIANHVMETVPVRWKGRHRRGTLVSIRVQVLVRKAPLPGVSHMASSRRQLVPPGEVEAVEPTPGGEFPLLFGRQLLAGPPGLGDGIAICDMDDWMVA